MEVEIEMQIFKEIGKNFESFLNNEENDRIIFSGKYGSGKTTFLKYFFEKPESLAVTKRDFKYFRISPVNYSISSNEDIIELIKYDLIIQFLLDETIEVQTSDIPSYQFLSKKDIKIIFRTLLSMINFKGIEIAKLIEGLKKLKEGLELRKSDLDEGDTFAIFLDKIENRRGVFERDLVTKMIENVFRRIKKGNVKVILIIDDLDRIDPEHIFRILNVFSAHFDEEIFNKRGQKNKFGFDKIIAVCDFNNIQSLFHQKYGDEADFAGYIDKFYSRSIFQFNIKNEIENYFRGILYKMNQNVVRRYSENFRGFGREELFEKTIIYSILYGIINIRTLNKLIDADIDDHHNMKSLNFISIRRDQHLYTFFLLKLNIYLFGGVQNLIKSINHLATYNFNFYIDIFLIEVMYIVESSKRSFENNIEIETSEGTFCFELKDENRQKTAIRIFEKSSEAASINSTQSYAILKNFLHKIRQITGVA